MPHPKVGMNANSGKLSLLSQITLTHFLFGHEHAGRFSSTFFTLRSQHGGRLLLVWRAPCFCLLTLSEGLFIARRCGYGDGYMAVYGSMFALVCSRMIVLARRLFIEVNEGIEDSKCVVSVELLVRHH